MASVGVKRKRSAYDAGFKLKVVEYAESNNNSKAGREFGVSEKLVRDWRKAKETLMDIPEKRLFMLGLQATRGLTSQLCSHAWQMAPNSNHS